MQLLSMAFQVPDEGLFGMTDFNQSKSPSDSLYKFILEAVMILSCHLTMNWLLSCLCIRLL
jgi:hypothetical protein